MDSMDPLDGLHGSWLQVGHQFDRKKTKNTHEAFNNVTTPTKSGLGHGHWPWPWRLSLIPNQHLFDLFSLFGILLDPQHLAPKNRPFSGEMLASFSAHTDPDTDIWPHKALCSGPKMLAGWLVGFFIQLLSFSRRRRAIFFDYRFVFSLIHSKESMDSLASMASMASMNDRLLAVLHGWLEQVACD